MAKTIASTKPAAWIVSPNDRGRKSIKNGKVFLNDEETFEIEIFNPLIYSVLADIKLNGQSISKTGLVIKPGQRVYLDCFIDDRKKFVYKTYEIENSEEATNATQNNGLLEVFFYKEETISIENWQNKFKTVIVEKWYCPTYTTYITYPIWYGTGSSNSIITSGSSTLTNSYYSSNNCSLTSNINPINSIETGRVEKGDESKQEFTEIDMEFEKHYIAHTIIQILPESRKPISTSDLKNDLTKKKKQGTSGNWPHQYENNTEGVIELIKKLSDLHLAGILTDEEFSNKKAELLSKI